MRGSSLKGLLVALAFGAAMTATAAIADDDDDFKSLMTDCNRPDLPLSDINGCIERARVLDETRPSPQLEHLLTQLERRTEQTDAPDSKKASPPPASAAPHTLTGTSLVPASTTLASAPDRDSRKSSSGFFSFLGFGSDDASSSDQGPSAQAAAKDSPRALGGTTAATDGRPQEYEAPDETAPAAEYEGDATHPPKQPSHD